MDWSKAKMALRDFATVPYVPIIDVRPAELFALDELPEKDKDLLLPLFKLRPWVATANLDHALTRLARSYGKRPCFLELGDVEATDPEKTRKVHLELAQLRSPEKGYKNWTDFFRREDCQHFIPVLQLSNQAEFAGQLEAMYGLGRGLAIRVNANWVDAGQFAKLTAGVTNSGRDVVFVLDYGKQSSGFADQKDAVKSQINAVFAECKNAPVVAVSASSFPDSFTAITRQPIFERVLFNKVRDELGGRVVYSDRGSARAEPLAGGGGLPAPRIDFAKADEWVFFREDSESARSQSPTISYQRQAKLLMSSPADWDSKLKLWGCQMIEKTAMADDAGIFSANRCTAARINIHLHQQLYYGNAVALYDTDEDWTEF